MFNTIIKLIQSLHYVYTIMISQESLTNMFEMVEAFNNKIGKSFYSEEIEYLLYADEYWELCEAFRKRDRAWIVDALIDMLYYTLYYWVAHPSHFAWDSSDAIEKLSHVKIDSYDLDTYVFTFDRVKSLQSDFSYRRCQSEKLKEIIEALHHTWLCEWNIMNYFECVHVENMWKMKAVWGKSEKPEWRQENTETKSSIVKNLYFKFQ